MRWVLLLLLCACSTMLPQQEGVIDVTFCPNCEQVYEEVMAHGKWQCAFYDLDEDAEGNDVLLFEENYRGFGTPVAATHSGLMHHKFCVRENVIWTGSMNPTYNGMNKNRNNLIFIEGEKLAANYGAELWYLSGADIATPFPLINHTFKGRSFVIENYFCPRDNCESEVVAELLAAKESIIFMVFSFTSDTIGDVLLQKYREGVVIQGMFDPGQVSQYSEYDRLENEGITVTLYKGEGKLHHKVFVIDGETVITGSYNPSRNGNERNNENVLIIHDREMAQLFLAEFEDLK